MWAAICKLFADIFSGIFKVGLKEYKEPTEVVTTGYDDEIEEDIDAEIDSEYDFLSNDHMRDED